MKASIEDIVELSKKNPGQVYTSDNGKYVFAGEVFNSKEDLLLYIKVITKSSGFLRFLHKIFNFFSTKK